MGSRPFRTLLCLLGALVAPGCGGGGTPSTAAPPTGLEVSWVTLEPPVILLTWKAPAGDTNAFEVEESLGGGPFRNVTPGGEIPPDMRSLGVAPAEAELPESAEIAFRVRSRSIRTFSDYTETKSVHFALRAPLLKGLEVTPQGPLLTWTNRSERADALLVERGTSASFGGPYAWTALPPLPAGEVRFLDAGAPERMCMAYRLTCSRGAEKGSVQSAPVFAPLRPPDLFQATIHDGGVRLSWRNNSATATQLLLTRDPGIHPDGAAQLLASLPLDATSYEDLQMPPGYYTYGLRAVRPGEDAAEAIPVSVVLLSDPGSLRPLTARVLSMPPATMGALDAKGSWCLASDDAMRPRIFLPAGETWTALDSEDAGSFVPGLQRDSLGLPHAAYTRILAGTSERVLVHAWFDGRTWRTKDVVRRAFALDPRIGGPLFVLDASDQAHFLWKSSAAAPVLEYACQSQAGSWLVEPIEGLHLDLDGGPLQMVVDGQGVPFGVLWTSATGTLIRRLGPGRWAQEQMPVSSPLASLKGLDALPLPGEGLQVCYDLPHPPGDGPYRRDLWVATRRNGAWDTPQVLATTGEEPGGGTQVCSAGSAGGRIAVCILSSTLGMRLLQREQGPWSSTLLSQIPGRRPFVQFDAAGRLHLAQRVTDPLGQDSVKYVAFDEP